ncbi:MAG: hypothetical protein QMD82_07055 [bacterium]|nr:hypothetical protein [bacterium]
MIFINAFLLFSQLSIGVFADPLAQGASVKFNFPGKFGVALILAGRQGEKTYSEWVADTNSGYSNRDTVGDFYWAKGELRLEYELGFKRGVKPYVALGLGINAEKLWLFNDTTSLWKSYSYSAIGGIGAIGLDVYPFTFLKNLFEGQSKIRDDVERIEEDFSIQLELINIYYKRVRGERPKPREYFYEYNNAGVSMGIGFFYHF